MQIARKAALLRRELSSEQKKKKLLFASVSFGSTTNLPLNHFSYSATTSFSFFFFVFFFFAHPAQFALSVKRAQVSPFSANSARVSLSPRSLILARRVRVLIAASKFTVSLNRRKDFEFRCFQLVAVILNFTWPLGLVKELRFLVN
ncbi:hypothetical protein GmHk_19G054692 [Glycine max]|nr:hypothetical protein GmHk_19G054692 [Glycine max]